MKKPINILILIVLLLASCKFINKKPDKYRKVIKGRYEIIHNINDTLLPENYAIVSGRVFGFHEKKYLEYVIVNAYLEDETFIQNNYTDTFGRFELKLKPGNYKFKTICVGTTSLTTEIIQVKENNFIELNFYLGTTITYGY